MKRIVISNRHGGSLVGREGKQIPLQKGRTEVEQEDLDVALSKRSFAALFEAPARIGLRLEPVAAAVQPPVASIAGPKPKAEKHEAKK